MAFTRLWRHYVSYKQSINSFKVTTVLLVAVFVLQISHHTLVSAVMIGNDELDESVPENKVPENPVSQIRYRTRPVVAFNSGNTKYSGNVTVNASNSKNETNSSDPSGPPFFAVHDLSSQTFEKLQENWRHVETFLRSLQARRSQDESQRSPQSSGGSGGVTTGSDQANVRRTPSFSNNNNVFTFRYHPVVLEGEGSTRDIDSIIGGSIPPRGFSGANQFGPFPFDPTKDHDGKPSDMERHTVATIYTIGICLTIMAIGSVMFILINKCDGTNGNSYSRTAPIHGVNGSRIARSVLASASRSAGSGGRQQNGRSRSNRQGPSTRSAANLEGGENSTGSSANIPASANSMFETDAKILVDLPPSYDSLFPESPSDLLVESQPCATSSASANNVILTNENENPNTHNLTITAPPTST